MAHISPLEWSYILGGSCWRLIMSGIKVVPRHAFNARIYQLWCYFVSHFHSPLMFVVLWIVLNSIARIISFLIQQVNKPFRLQWSRPWWQRVDWLVHLCQNSCCMLLYHFAWILRGRNCAAKLELSKTLLRCIPVNLRVTSNHLPCASLGLKARARPEVV